MGCWWTNFATSGDPNVGESGCAETFQLPHWATTQGTGDAMVLTNTSMAMVAKLQSKQCDVFAQYP